MVNDLRDISIDEIYDFVENGVASEEKSEVMLYMLEMEKVRGMALRIDKYASKDAIVNHLIKINKYSRYYANKLYNQTMEYFYCDTDISRAAWRNIYAEKMEKVINFAIATMENTADASKVSKMIMEMAKVRNLDQPDKDEFPEEMFTRPFKIYSVDPEFVGMPSIDRAELAKFIDDLPELPEAHKIQIKREARILPLKVFLDEHEDPRKA